MPPRTVRPRTRKPFAPLCVEALEDRRLLSGLGSLLDDSLSLAPSAPAALVALQPSDPAAAAQPGEGLGATVHLLADAVQNDVAQLAAAVSADVELNGNGLHLGQLGLSNGHGHQPSGGPHGDSDQSGGPQPGPSVRLALVLDQSIVWAIAAFSGLIGDSQGPPSRGSGDKGLGGRSDQGTTDHLGDQAIGVTVQANPRGSSPGSIQIGPVGTGGPTSALTPGPGPAPVLSGRLIPVDGPEENVFRDILRVAHDEKVELPSATAIPAMPRMVPRAVLALEQASVAVAIPAHRALNPNHPQVAGNLPFVASARPSDEFWLWGQPGHCEEFASSAQTASPREAQSLMAVAAQASDLAGAADEVEVVLPESGTLAAGVLPVDMNTLDEAVRRFLGGLDTAGRELTRVLSKNGWARWVAVAAITGVAAELGRRRFRRSTRQMAGEEEDNATLSWFAGSYPFRPDDY